MTVDEAEKINALYKQLDVLTAENNALKEQLANHHDHSELLDRLKAIENKLDGGKK
tara:strand:+ start:792 stop:959 length:168 start_codon:yes stop_codon:yes gene_type:complete